MTRTDQIFHIAMVMVLAVGAQAAEAATIVETTSTPITVTSGNSATFSFAPVTNADELVSVSQGTVASPEGGSINVTLDYFGGTSASLFSSTIGAGTTFNFSSISNLVFPAGTIEGLTFSYTGTYGLGYVSLPTGTAFTFRAATTDVSGVPEPVTWATMLLGLGAVGFSLRRHKRVTIQTAS